MSDLPVLSYLLDFVANQKIIAFHSTDDEVITNVYVLTPSYITPVVSEAQIVISEFTGIYGIIFNFYVFS